MNDLQIIFGSSVRAALNFGCAMAGIAAGGALGDIIFSPNQPTARLGLMAAGYYAGHLVGQRLLGDMREPFQGVNVPNPLHGAIPMYFAPPLPPSPRRNGG